MSLKSTKEVLASYEEFRGHLANNIMEHSWSEDNPKERKDPEKRSEDILQHNLGRRKEEESVKIKICNSWSQASENSGPSAEPCNNRHVEETQYCCSQCDYVCLSSSAFSVHVRIHENGKPYSCTQCDFSCSRSYSLKRHMMVHTGEKPYSCTQCDYSCSRPNTLKIHMRIHTGEKAYSCPQCAYSCSHSSSLKKHMMIHTGENPYNCTQCDYSGSTSNNLKKHMRIHTGEKPSS